MCPTAQISLSPLSASPIYSKCEGVGAKAALAARYILSPIVLGEGTFAQVRQAIQLDTFEKVAVKVVTKSCLKEADRLSIQKEIGILKYLQSCPHDNIIKLLDCFEDEEYVIMVFELFETDLYEYLKKHQVSEVAAKPILSQIISGLAHLHKHGIVHCDIKPENVLFNPLTGHAVLADFGFADICCEGKKLTRYHGSFGYVSPEVVMHRPYDRKVDIWSLGVLAFVLLTRRLPFYNKDEKVELLNILRGDFHFLPKDKISESSKAFLQSLLRLKASRRPKASTLMASKWLYGSQEILF